MRSTVATVASALARFEFPCHPSHKPCAVGLAAPSLLTPCFAHRGPGGPCSHLLHPLHPFQVDSWSRNAYRNALATGPPLAPVNTYLLAAPTAADRAAWIDLIERVKLPHPKQHVKVNARRLFVTDARVVTFRRFRRLPRFPSDLHVISQRSPKASSLSPHDLPTISLRAVDATAGARRQIR